MIKLFIPFLFQEIKRQSKYPSTCKYESTNITQTKNFFIFFYIYIYPSAVNLLLQHDNIDQLLIMNT